METDFHLKCTNRQCKRCSRIRANTNLWKRLAVIKAHSARQKLVTFRLSGTRDKPVSKDISQVSFLGGKIGEPDRIRTCDPLIKSQLLYQLSYGPDRWTALLGLAFGVKR